VNWQHFQTYNEAPTRAFETMCNQLFELWCKKTYSESLKTFNVVNGSGGDGGVESFATLQDGTIIGMQAKWFLESITSKQFRQIKDSIMTALKVRPLIKKYIVCIPRDLSSDRIGKGGGNVKESELDRWTKQKDELEKNNRGLEIELWNNTRLLTILQDSDAAGIYRYWFEKSEISRDLIVYSFEKQKSGWLSQKYTPNLHVVGQIQKKIKEFLGTLDNRKNNLNKLYAVSLQCKKFIRACDDYLEFVQEHTSQEELIKQIHEKQEQVNILLGKINEIIEALKNEQHISYIIGINDWSNGFSEFIELLKGKRKIHENYFHISDIIKSAKAIQESEIHSIIQDIHAQLNHNKYLILGNPGTGKKHGVANLAETLLNQGYHIPILIRAKVVDPNNNWVDMISKSIGLSSTWNEIEIFQALEALSYRIEINNVLSSNNNEVKIVPKILICIDGLDESKPYDLWYDRLREIEAIYRKYPRVKFCITSRPYAFKGLRCDDDLLNNKLILPYDGDVPVYELFPTYIKTFNINMEGCSWIKWSIKTPLALRIFCENNKNRTVSGINKSSLTITNLLSKKFEIIEKEFHTKYETEVGDKEFIIRNSLLAIAKKFLVCTTLDKDELIDSLKDVSGLITATHDYRRVIVDFMEDYGILQSSVIHSNNILEQTVIKYSIGIQPFFDFLLALLVTNQIKDPSDVTLTDGLLEQKGALQMISILLLEDYEYLITENRSFREKLSNDELFDLVCFSLSSVSPKPASRYIGLVKKMMSYNAYLLKSVVNKNILPVSRIEDHPLGASILHEYMMSFENAGKRDIVWSVTDYLIYPGDAPWKCYTVIDLKNKTYELCSEDKYNGIPLIYAWMLTSVNNVERVGYRRELMKWASMQPIEYYKLFVHTWNTNDPQMREDLFSFAMGTVFMLEKGHPCIKLFSDWIINNIFAPDKISMHYNCAIRYYSRAIVERSYEFGNVVEEDLVKSRPPYKTNRIISLNREATAGSRMGGYGPINYDLARYVLCDPISRMFFSSYGNIITDEEKNYELHFTEKEIKEILSKHKGFIKHNCKEKLREILLAHKKRRNLMESFINVDIINDDADITTTSSELPVNKYNKEVDSFLSEQANTIGMESLEPIQFILSAAYAYILEQGWNEKEFYNTNDKKTGEVIGVDIAILRRFSHATHGAKSRVMTFCEKYTWCARNEILGYLADRLPYRDYEKELLFLVDYGLLDDFPNPAQELSQNDDPDEIMERTSWFIPEELSPLINENIGEDALRQWIIEAPIPSFIKWIELHNFNHEAAQGISKNWMALYSYSFISNDLGGESLMWISSAIIAKENFKYLINDIVNKKHSLVYDLRNPEELHSCTESSCYITPKEVCWMNWKNECNNKIQVVTIYDGDFVKYTIEKAVEECVVDYPEFGEVYYKLPSRIIRNLLEICDGDGYKYYNGEKQLNAIWFTAGEKWHDSQAYLCVDQDKLLSQLETRNYMIFWVVRLLRKATIKAREKYPKLSIQSDKCWIAWFENGELRNHLFLEQEE